MPSLLSLIDAVVSGLGDEQFSSRVHSLAAILRRNEGPAASSVVRAESLVESLSECLSVSLASAYELMGERVVPLLAREMAAQLRLHSTAHTFCLHLNAIVQSELQALVPAATLPVIDVEMLDFTALRLSFVGDGNALALAKGLLSGVARCYGQEARFAEVPASQMSRAAVQLGRRYVDLTFVSDSRVEVGYKARTADEKRRGTPTVALKGPSR